MRENGFAMGYQIQRKRYAWTWRSYWKLERRRQQFAKIKKNTISDAKLVSCAEDSAVLNLTVDTSATFSD